MKKLFLENLFLKDSMKKYFTVLFDNQDLLIVNKQARVDVAQSNDYPVIEIEKEIYNQYKKYYQAIYPLDYLVSGVLFLVDSASLSLLKEMQQSLAHHEFCFTYEFLVRTPYLLKEKKIKLWLHQEMGKKISLENGKTLFEMDLEIIKEYKDFIHLRATSSSVWISALFFAMSYMGNPIVGDRQYGLKDVILLSHLKKKRYKSKNTEKEIPLLQRPALHLTQVEYHHQVYRADLPKEMQAVINNLEKYNRFMEESSFQDILDHLKR